MLLNWYFLLFFFFVNQSDANLDDHPAWKKLPTRCGRARAQSRIVGGEEAGLGQFPWMARVGYRRGRYSITFFCGASLISSRHLISAAHCFDGEENYFVRLGEHDFETEVDCEDDICAPQPQDIPLAKIYIHESYSEKDNYNDIALLEMKYDAILNEFVQAICMPQGQIQDAQYKHTGEAIVAGWGLMSSSEESSSKVLMSVRLTFTELRKCVNLYKSVRTDRSQICVGRGIGKDSCGGDSGGPLMKTFRLQNEPSRFFLIGIVSFGLENCGVGPAIYTNVAFYMEWILDIINEF